jgi:hypothetical protein
LDAQHHATLTLLEERVDCAVAKRKDWQDKMSKTVKPPAKKK